MNGPVLVAPELLKIIKNWAGRKNSLAHGNPAKFEPDSLKDLLTAVRDVLWLCDITEAQYGH